MAKHWSEILSCHLCGKRFRSMSAESYHRHNAAIVCKGYPKEEKKPDPGMPSYFDRVLADLKLK